jgi:phosphate starvation-inducible protein PhoH
MPSKKRATKKSDTSPLVHQNEKINFDLKIKEYPWTERQQKIIDTVLNEKADLTLIDGIWGSGKSLLSVYICLRLLQAKKISNILYIRNIVQSGSGTLGWLGGDLDTRLGPYMLPLKQKLDELLPQSQVNKLISEGYVQSQPVALLRGTSYNCYGIIIDEIGCMTEEDILLSLSRVGQFSYVFGVGDSWQVDVKDSGFRKIYETFDDEESREHKIFAFELQEEQDILRSEFLKYIMKKVKSR